MKSALRPLTFHWLFSGIYLITFLAGVPLSCLLSQGFAHPFPNTQALWLAVFSYLVYFFTYHLAGGAMLQFFRTMPPLVATHVVSFEQAKRTAVLLSLLSVSTLTIFVLLNNGFLLLSLEKYHQIFSPQVNGVALKRFFYFFIPAMLIWFFLKPNHKRWWGFLVFGLGLGVLSYLAVGGTRGNMAIAFALFLLLGLQYRYLSRKWLGGLVFLAVVAMFFLALIRYNLSVSGRDAWFTFLYLTRDTFSPWENFARILSYPIEYQGLMPIVRDFYVYIPQWLWADRPEIVWNTANYFTKTLLGNYSGLAMSPTLLGSFYIMGGLPMIMAGMVAVGILMRLADKLLDYGRQCGDVGFSAMIQSYCFANLFNLIVLVREGMDAFVSRFAFFSLIFIACCLLAKWIGGKQRG